MKKYIDVDLAKSELEDLDESGRLYYMGVFDVINSQPAADAEEVRHGAWEIVGRTKSNSAILKCSCCQRVRKGHGKSSYCPDCGAKMDIVLSINRAKGTHKED